MRYNIMSFADKFGKPGDKKPTPKTPSPAAAPKASEEKKGFADKQKKFSERHKGSFVEQQKNTASELVYLVRGKDRGMAAWHYVLVDKMKLPLFLNKIKSGNIDVSLYGDVLYSGWGEDPSEDIVKKIEEQYG